MYFISNITVLVSLTSCTYLFEVSASCIDVIQPVVKTFDTVFTVVLMDDTDMSANTHQLLSKS